jgi:hypothetical protein
LAACHPLDDLQITVHTAAWKAFDSFVKSVPKDELEPLVVPLRRTIKSTGAIGQLFHLHLDAMDEIGIEIQCNVGDTLFCSSR